MSHQLTFADSEFSSIADRITHHSKSTAINKVNNKLHFMDTFKIKKNVEVTDNGKIII